MHGTLDTSLGWVSNGVTGSQAFAAYDMGLDVWLGNSRSNPPRRNTGAGWLPASQAARAAAGHSAVLLSDQPCNTTMYP